MSLIRPRLNDYYDLSFTQEDVNFAIPLLDDDIPLYVDPFLLWKSPSQQDRSLHQMMVRAFDTIVREGVEGNPANAVNTLIALSECPEVGLGHAEGKIGRRIGEQTAESIIHLYHEIPRIQNRGIEHIEALQLVIKGISRDRVSDLACSLLKSFLIDFTIEACRKYNIPTKRVRLDNIFDDRRAHLVSEEIDLPVNYGTDSPILLVPKRWLRRNPWISFDEFTKFTIATSEPFQQRSLSHEEVLNYNRANYDMVVLYVEQRERTSADCKNDPLFTPIPIVSARKKLNQIKKLPSGNSNGVDKTYEDAVTQLLASLFYPQLDFAAEQVRTDSGTTIRDLVFYNNRTVDFLQEVHTQFDARQLVFELKNVIAIEREHVNQLNRYLGGSFGRFGVFVTRNAIPRAMYRHTIDLWSGQRKCILTLTDSDLETMVTVFESKQRLPIEVLKRVWIEFTRACPS